jgi:4-amino-4-deoxy-L-arabinose transferase-like glycosyltransferase
VNQAFQAPARWQSLIYGLIALVACIGAFAGMSASGLWIDELFTVYLIHHDGGFGEVFRRALTDTHPPLYYFFLYAWTRVAGLSEWAVRLPSAIFAVAAIVIFAFGTRHVLSRTAIAFACAIASVSAFWFDQSQNARSYALCFALAAGLLSLALAFRRRVRTRTDFPVAHWLGLSVLGLIASLTHAYMLLALGMVLAFLLLSVPSWRIRGALIVTGLVVLAINAAYYKVMIHSSEQDLHNLWFGNSAGFFKQQIRFAFYGLMQRQVIVVTALLILLGVRQKMAGEPYFAHDEHDTRWATLLAGFVLIGVILCGIGVSLAVAPSFSDRNLLTCLPFAWLLVGLLYDACGPRGYTRGSIALAVLAMLLVGSYLLRLPGRELPRREAWRPSAQFVSQLPGCTGQRLPAILPYRFGHASPHFRALAEHDFFGYYMPQGTQIRAYMPAELAARHSVEELPPLLSSRAANADTGACALLAWGIHDLDETSALKVALDLARQPGVATRRVLMQEFISYQPRGVKWEDVVDGYVYLAVPKAAPGRTVTPPAAPDVRLSKENAAALGDRVVVEYLSTYTNPTQPAYQIDLYAIQRWDRIKTAREPVHQDFVAVHRLTCDAPVTKSNWDVWPDPEFPGCSNLPPPTSAGRLNGQL